MSHSRGRGIKPNALIAAAVCMFGLAFSLSESLQGRRETPAAVTSGSGPTPFHGLQPAGVQMTTAANLDDSAGCITCHKETRDPHPTRQLATCVECHGGNGTATKKEDAHPKASFPDKWKSSANPHESYTLLNHENRDWIRFVNPGDLRTADLACGRCHRDIVRAAKKNPMVNSAQVYSTALYNNGTVPFRDAVFGENYSIEGEPQIIRTVPPPTAEQTRLKGILPVLYTFPRFEVVQPSNIFRVFERGGGPKSELGNPNREDVPGQPDVTTTNRGFGTQAAVDPFVIGAHKTRLNDPVTSFFGTNDAPGDYRSSGCTSCHVIYANDRNEYNSGPYAKYGNRGLSVNPDPTIPKDEPSHPIRHEFTRAIPTSQCITCHVHNGNGFLNSYMGYMWWDEQTDGEHFYPAKQHNPTEREIDHAGRFNPEEAASRGLWHDVKFLETISEKNPQLRKMQVSDYHGHGWIFRRVYHLDRKGNYLDKDGARIPFEDPDLFKKAVHLKDSHLEKGMHCVDCHFEQDNHGNGNIYGDRRAAIEIACQDCHGSVKERARLTMSGPAASPVQLLALRTPFNQRRFERQGNRIIQRSMVTAGVEWDVPQVLDTVTPGQPGYSEASRLAKTIRRDGVTWGDGGAPAESLAHDDSRMQCFTCHSAWTTSCYGCHLAARVNTKKPMIHMEGTESQVYASYNPQVLRSDGFAFGVDGSIGGHRIAPVRSSSVVTLSVQNANREWIVNQVPTISSAGYSGNAFNVFVPHTVRGKETKQCTDCHPSAEGDNNAWLASVMMLGTNHVNFMTRYVYVARGSGGVSGIGVTERDEPQAVYGSDLHKLAFPDYFKRFVDRGGALTEAHHHGGHSNQVQMYSEYLLSAGGPSGFQVYDIANIGNKGFSQRIVTTPFRTQRMAVRTKDATGIAIGSSSPLDPKRVQLPQNEELPVAPLFGYAFISDREEGLITVDITTLVDGIPTNNGLQRAATYNPGGQLTGATSITLIGNYAYMTTSRGLAIVEIKDPQNPRLVTEIGAPALNAPTRVAAQFRYAFVTDADGIKVLDITSLEKPRLVTGATIPLKSANGIYVSRTYAYVAAGADGLAIIDIERPERPKLDQMFTGGGAINDARDVKVGMAFAGLFAFIGDGRNGLRIVELASPNSVPGFSGFSPRPAPQLIATYKSDKPVISVSEGYRRDRGADESRNQIGQFGRRGSRPLNREEAERLYLRNGQLYTVTNQPPGPPKALTDDGLIGTLRSYWRKYVN